jgi:hypothetical protein
VDLEKFIIEFHDRLAPCLDTYEQAIYLYVFRHSRLIGKEEVVIGFKSARARMACGIGEKGKPMSENTAYVKLQSLSSKGCIEIVASEREGRRLRLRVPSEIPGLIPDPAKPAQVSIEDLDFFDVLENRPLILKRDGYHCFYCLHEVDDGNYVLEHVISRPTGNNSYSNLVTACRACNNRKKATAAEEFLRLLYREQFLDKDELEERLANLTRLRNGELKPDVAG